MSTPTIIMITMICVGCALIIAGLAFAAVRGFRLMGAAKEAGLSSMDQVQEVVSRSQQLAPKLEELAVKQKAVAERLERLSATTSELNYLKDQLDEATGHLRTLKS